MSKRVFCCCVLAGARKPPSWCVCAGAICVLVLAHFVCFSVFWRFFELARFWVGSGITNSKEFARVLTRLQPFVFWFRRLLPFPAATLTLFLASHLCVCVCVCVCVRVCKRGNIPRSNTDTPSGITSLCMCVSVYKKHRVCVCVCV